MPKDNNIPMSSPHLTEDDINAVTQVLETPHLSQGPKVAAFEEAIASYVGSRHAVAVNSGTSGLHLAVIAAGIDEGDLVITTPFSFIASANCILFERAIPIFVDIDPQTKNIDPGQVAQAAEDLTSGGEAARRWLPRSLRASRDQPGELKAILAVDVFGQPADFDPLREVADRYGLALIEDSVEALGAEYKNRKAGTLGDVGAFAFYPNKQMTTGEGGMLVTDHQEWANLFRSLRNQGRDAVMPDGLHHRLGYNYRMDEMSAALGLSQFQRIDDLLVKRERVAAWYNDRLSELPDLSVPGIIPDTTIMSWFVYVIQARTHEIRDSLVHGLREEGIPTRPYFNAIHLQPFYIDQYGYREGDFPSAEHAGQTCIALPFSGVMCEGQIDYVCESLRRFVDESSC